MNSPENIEKLIKNAVIHSNPDVNQAVLKELLQQFDDTREQKPAVMQPNIRRTIMKSPITKIAAVAAVITLVALGLFEFIDTGSTSGVVWAEVARKVQASQGVIFRSIEEIVPDTYDRGVDFSMEHYSSTQSRLDGYKGGEIIKTIYSDCNTKTVILVDHYHKSYVKMTFEETMPDGFGMADPNSMVQGFLSHEYRELGPKTIDGLLCEGFETTDPAFYGGGKLPEPLMARVWVSVETGYPVQFEGEYVSGNDQTRYSCVRDQFQWDVELDPSLFEANIPPDYEQM